jgi:hypothetical protein
MSEDPELQAVSSAVVPVAGLVALAGRTLRHGDYVALRALATADPGPVAGMLLTADRFCRPEAPVPLSRDVRVSLLDRLGLFGIRLSLTLIRAGVPDASTLADELLRRSGLTELQRLLHVHFTARGEQLKAATALRMLAGVLREHPVAGADELLTGLERLRLAASDAGELELLARCRSPRSPLPAELRAEGERLLGAGGTDPAARLGLPEGTPDAALRTAARAALDRWRGVGEDPLADRATADAAEVVVRSCALLLAGLDGWPGGSAAGPATGEVAGGTGEQREQGEDERPGGGDQGPAVDV